MGLRVHRAFDRAARSSRLELSERGGPVSIIVWIVLAVSLAGSIKLLIDNATSDRRSNRADERDVRRPTS
jgi:hypothetical protein